MMTTQASPVWPAMKASKRELVPAGPSVVLEHTADEDGSLGDNGVQKNRGVVGGLLIGTDDRGEQGNER